MNPPGGADLRLRTRRALLDALEALAEQRDAIVVIGAQAVLLRTGAIEAAIPEETKDADLGVDAGALRDDPRLEQALERAGFYKDSERPQPGGWISRDGIPVDLMIPEAMAGPAAPLRRGARVPPHDKGAMRRAAGLEAIVVDWDVMTIDALEEGDARRYEVRVAGPGALLVAKLHKLGERDGDGGERLKDKDAHDLYRLLVAVGTADLAAIVARLLEEAISAEPTRSALGCLADLFAAGPEATGSVMAGRAEEGVGDEPAVVSAAVATLATDLLEAVEKAR